MKLITSLFAFYILLLPCYTCTDGDDCNETTETHSTSANNAQHHEDEKNSCNPFCNCSCCAQLIVNNFHQPKLILDTPFESIKQLYYFNTHSLSAAYLGNIWQPPKNC